MKRAAEMWLSCRFVAGVLEKHPKLKNSLQRCIYWSFSDSVMPSARQKLNTKIFVHFWFLNCRQIQLKFTYESFSLQLWTINLFLRKCIPSAFWAYLTIVVPLRETIAAIFKASNISGVSGNLGDTSLLWTFTFLSCDSARVLKGAHIEVLASELVEHEPFSKHRASPPVFARRTRRPPSSKVPSQLGQSSPPCSPKSDNAARAGVSPAKF